MIVADANVVIMAGGDGDGTFLQQCAAPPLMHSELLSVLHASCMKGLITEHDALATIDLARTVRTVEPEELAATAWRLASTLGWHKTYDAEYLALANITGAEIATLDGRMIRAAQRLGISVHDLT